MRCCHNNNSITRLITITACFLVVFFISSSKDEEQNVENLRFDETGNKTIPSTEQQHQQHHNVVMNDKVPESNMAAPESLHNNNNNSIPMTGTMKNEANHSIMIRHVQIENYKRGQALLFNIHVTHHAGTTICSRLGYGPGNGPTPPFACMGPGPNANASVWPPELDPVFWAIRAKDTQHVVDIMRRYYRLVAVEYRCHGRLDMDWSYPHLVSIAVMRHPLDRFLAGGKCGKAGKEITLLLQRAKKQQQEENNNNATISVPSDLWWQYANDDCNDNCALHVFSNNERTCCQGANTSRIHLIAAQEMLKQFTFVLDMECLDESLEEMGRILNMTVNVPPNAQQSAPYHAPARERLKNDTLYHFLLDRFKLDIELYNWSKTISLVNCSSLTKQQQQP